MTTAMPPTSTMTDSSSLHSFLQSGLTLLYKYASKKHELLRSQCVEVLSRLKSEEKMRADQIAGGVNPQNLPPVDTDANKYFLPLKSACDTGQAKLVAIALDTMEKLIAYGYLDGNATVTEEVYPTKKKESGTHPAIVPATKNDTASPPVAATTNGESQPPTSATSTTEPPKRKLIHVMIETLYECSMYKDPLVQRQVVKALLTTVSSVSCPVHDHGLLQAVTSCYQIYLQAGDETNRTTSKAALTQIFNLVFQRMEHFAAQLKELEATSAQQREQDKLNSIKMNEGIPTTTADSPSSTSIDNTDTASTTVENSTDTNADGTLDMDSMAEATPVEPAIGADESDGGEFTAASTSAASTPSHSSLSKTGSTLASRPPPGKRGYCIVCGKPANHSCLQTRDPVCGMECKLLNLSKKDPLRMNALSVKTKIQNKLQILQNDAYYLLRALIKLSHKSFLTIPPEPAAVDSKLLSLTLLLSVMQNAGPTFETNKNFIQLVKVDLVNCLLRNSAASNIDSIFTLTSNIFIALLQHFKPHLHKVIGPMLDSIYLPYIQSPNSSFEHKQTSLNVLKAICENNQLVVDLFLNYDCDLASFSTFQKIAETLEKTTHMKIPEAGTVSDDDAHLTIDEQIKLKNLALEALVGCMNSLAAWTYRIVKPNQQQMEELEAAMEHASSSTGGRTTALAAIGAAAAAAAMNAGGDSSPSSKLHRSSSLSDSLSVDSSSTATASPSPPPQPISTGLTLASSFSTQFQFLRAQKQKLDTGVAKFNQKPKVGLAYLQQHGLLGTEPSDIATFFHSNAGLDKIQLGDYMGDEGEFNRKVLYAYVEQMDFRQMTFDDSIRLFVQGFRLPGEAQKIDRMMEKFAEQYHKNNPGRFHSADTAYVLAYSIILLNTDAHNPGVKRRMTKEDFFKNCRGIDDGKDIDPGFLGEIYDRITTNEIKMKSDPLVNSDPAKPKATNANGDTKKRFTAFVKESQQMVKRTQELIKTKTTSQPKMGNQLSNNERKYLDEISKDELDQPENTAGSTNTTGPGLNTTNGSDSINTTNGSDKASDKSSSHEKVFYQATDADAEAIRPMFEILCFPSLATFSVLLEESDSDHVIRLCLQGYRSSIRIANALEIQTARLAFVSSLKKFTFLGSGKEMKPKNIEAISTLLNLAATTSEGNYLKDNWFEVLQCISEIERLHLIANNSLRGREINFTQELVSGGSGAPLPPTNGAMAIPGIHTPLVITGGNRPSLKETETLNSLQVHLIDSTAIDRVFAASAHLDGEAIIDFVNALRQVSEQELSNIHSPRVFSLQKMVEITYFNMGRIRVVWNRIWSLLSEFFQKAGCHPHLNVSMYAIDSLRQLAMKFLEKEELSSYQFQKQFFKPFEFIMNHNEKLEIRELVLQCISRMITSKVHNIKSGWKGVFMVLTVAGNCTENSSIPTTKGGSSSLIELAFSILSNIMENYFNLISETGLETMDECVNCLVTFGCNQQFNQIASKSIQYLTNCASQLNKEANTVELTSATPSTPSSSAAAHSTAGLLTPTSTPLQRRDSIHSNPSTPKLGASHAATAMAVNAQVTLKVWFLVLTGLSRMVGDSRAEVRSLALTTLFHILNSHGHVFSTATWRAVFHGVLFPIFDDVRYANEKLPTSVTDSAHPSPEHSTMKSSRGDRHDQFEAEKQAAMWKDIPSPDDDTTNVNGDGTTVAAVTSTVPSSPAPRKTSSGSASKPPMTPATTTATATQPTTPATAHRSVASTGTPATVSRPRSKSIASSQQFDHSWLQTTCFTALSSLVDLFARFHSTVYFLLPEILKLVNSCISQDHSEDLAKIGVRCLVVLLQKIGADLSVGDWWIVLQSSSEIITKILPKVLIGKKVREALLLPPMTGPHPTVYQSFIKRTRSESVYTNATLPVATAIPTTSTTTTAPTSEPTNLAAPTDNGATSHHRTSSAQPAAPVAPITLPFVSSAVLTRIKVQAWLVEGIFQVVMSFFPKKDQHILRVREDRLEEELSTPPQQQGITELNLPTAAAASAVPTIPSATTANATGLFQTRDRRLLGCLSPSQALFAVDLLGECINFTHAFNADITLRRKLHSAGFFIPVPSVATQQTGTPPPTTGAPTTGPTTAAALHPPIASHPPIAPHPVPAGPPKPARLPQLFYHEAHALRLSMDIIFKLVIEGNQLTPPPATAIWREEVSLQFESDGVDNSSSDAISLAEERIIGLCRYVMDEYVTKTQSGQLVSLENMDEVLVGLIHNFTSLPQPLFLQYLPRFYIGFTQLIEYGNGQTIRQAIRILFAEHIAPLLKLAGMTTPK